MTKTNDPAAPPRCQFPFNEADHQWLMPSQDACYVADKGIYKAIEREVTKGRELARTMKDYHWGTLCWQK